MWGNRLGWGLSAALVILVMAMILAIQLTSGVSPPTAMGRQAAAQVIQLPANPDAIVPMNDPGDAGAIYRQVIELVKQDPRLYNQDRPTIPRDADSQAKIKPVMDLLIQATRLRRMDLFTRNIEQTVKYDYPADRRRDLRAIYEAGIMARTLGLIRRGEGKHEEAQQLFEAAFALGAKMFRERVVFEEMQRGYDLMTGSARAMADQAQMRNDTARHQQLLQFQQDVQTYFNNEVTPIWGRIHTIDPPTIRRHTGDWFLLAQEAQETMWRTEAALQLGLLPWMGGRVGDQRGAGRILKNLADNPNEDPAVRAAANAALNMTVTVYRQLGS